LPNYFLPLTHRAEIYRSDDGGRSGRSFPVPPIRSLPCPLAHFATDRLLGLIQRSTDGVKPGLRPAWLLCRSEGNREILGTDELPICSGDQTTRRQMKPAWSWPGRLAFQSDRTGNWEIFSLRAGCSPQTE
jgi:hypothetical protein